MPVIAIFGPDGSGKSTQITLLANYLKDMGVKTRRTWVCSHHLFTWIFFKVFVLLGDFHYRPSDLHPLEKYPAGRIFKGKVFTTLLLVTEVVSLWIKIFFEVYLPSLIGTTIIIERYIAGSLADFLYAYRVSVDSFTAKIVLSLINLTDTTFIFLDADYRTIEKRRKEGVEPRDYIETQRKVYAIFAKNFNCVTINTATATVQQTHEIIRRLVSQRVLRQKTRKKRDDSR